MEVIIRKIASIELEISKCLLTNPDNHDRLNFLRLEKHRFYNISKIYSLRDSIDREINIFEVRRGMVILVNFIPSIIINYKFENADLPKLILRHINLFTGELRTDNFYYNLFVLKTQDFELLSFDHEKVTILNGLPHDIIVRDKSLYLFNSLNKLSKDQSSKKIYVSAVIYFNTYLLYNFYFR